MHWTALTRAQGGLVSREQLAATGLTEKQSRSLLDGGRLERTRNPAVLRAAGAPSTEQTPAWFAVLATRSPVSFLTAGWWWEFPVEEDGLIHITRFDRRRLDWPTGVRVHRVALNRSAVVVRRGLPATSRVETLLDCLGWLSPGRAASLADRAQQQQWLTAADLERRLENQPGRWGNRRLRALLALFGDRAAAESERRLHRILGDAAIDGWVPNLSVEIGGRRWEIDVAFPLRRLAIEVDGRRYHSADDRFQNDRTKQNALILAGWTVLRFTWDDIVNHPEMVVQQILELLAA